MIHELATMSPYVATGIYDRAKIITELGFRVTLHMGDPALITFQASPDITSRNWLKFAIYLAELTEHYGYIWGRDLDELAVVVRIYEQKVYRPEKQP